MRRFGFRSCMTSSLRCGPWRVNYTDQVPSSARCRHAQWPEAFKTGLHPAAGLAAACATAASAFRLTLGAFLAGLAVSGQRLSATRFQTEMGLPSRGLLLSSSSSASARHRHFPPAFHLPLVLLGASAILGREDGPRYIGRAPSNKWQSPGRDARCHSCWRRASEFHPGHALSLAHQTAGIVDRPDEQHWSPASPVARDCASWATSRRASWRGPIFRRSEQDRDQISRARPRNIANASHRPIDVRQPVGLAIDACSTTHSISRSRDRC